jgi:tetratricopeptide (TPR) repeat protein
VEFRVLGSVEATADGAPVDLGSRKQRLVLAVLLLEAGRPVSLERLVDLLWPTAPPASARNTVQALISRLRGVFRAADGPELATEGPGYVLRATPDAVDAHRFTALVRRARAAGDETAVALLDEALALWRGDALAGAASAEVAERLLAGLHEARWSALEDRIDAQLRLGDPHEAIACGVESLRLCEELAIPGVTMALANLGFACGQVGDHDEALRHFGRALEIAERDGARFSVAVLLVDLGHVYRDLESPLAVAFYERALTANRELGYQYGEAAALSGRAVLEARAGDATRALADAAEAVELTRRIGDRGTEASALAAWGETCLHLGQAADAVPHLTTALDIARETSFTWCEAAALTGLAEAAFALGETEQARTHGEAAAKLAAQAGYRPLETRAAQTLGTLTG